MLLGWLFSIVWMCSAEASLVVESSFDFAWTATSDPRTNEQCTTLSSGSASLTWHQGGPQDTKYRWQGLELIGFGTFSCPPSPTVRERDNPVVGSVRSGEIAKRLQGNPVRQPEDRYVALFLPEGVFRPPERRSASRENGAGHDLGLLHRKEPPS